MDGGKDVGKNNRHIRAYSLIWMDYGTYGGQMREIVLYHSRYFGAWLTLDTFGFSVILNIDYMSLIIRIGALVVLIGR